jgi:hypothetical protein
MILILGTRHNDPATDAVVDWLLYQGAIFLKLTREDFAEGRVKVDIGGGATCDSAARGGATRILFKGIDLVSAVNVVWYRRLDGQLDPFGAEKDRLNRSELQFHGEMNDEYGHLLQLFFYLLRGKQWLPNYASFKGNKLVQLEKAKAHGFRVPATRVVSRKEEVVEFCAERREGIVNKPIYYVGYYYANNYAYTAFTNTISPAVLETMPWSFFPSLFQERIKGDYEIRTIFLDGGCYSCVWYNGREGKHVDKKLNGDDRDSHYMPYALPAEVKRRIADLMRDLELEIGMIDLIKRGEEYIFLEVNPAGQFLFESYVCNFYIEKGIAEWLIRRDNI